MKQFFYGGLVGEREGYIHVCILRLRTDFCVSGSDDSTAGKTRL